jgi:hypothetical protein
VYYLTCKVYNRWKINNQGGFGADRDLEAEFGVDDYIRTKASYAESLMNLGDLPNAIEKYENAKKSYRR